MVPTHLDPVLHEYFAECEELSERVSQSLQLLEKGQSSPDLIDSIYRDIHTLKGSSQLFGFKYIGDLGHSMESSLDPVRRNALLPSPRQLELLFQSLDLIVEMIKALKASSEEDFSGRVDALIPKLIDEALILEGSAAQPIPRDVLSMVMDAVLDAKPPLTPKIMAIPEKEIPAPPPQVIPQPVYVKEPEIMALPADTAPAPAEAIPTPNSVQTHTPAADAHVGAQPAAHEPSESSSSIRVPVNVLDKLMTLTGEMVLVRNQVLQYANKSDHLEFLNLSQRLDVVTSEIQGEVMKTRMQPIGNVLTKFQRVIRDLAKELGKKIDLSLAGNETELDKTLLEAIKDPLMHIVRNSCDHGIERIEERKAAGKPETGQIAIRSFHEGGQVIIEITDNGKGLDRTKLTQKAIEKGILTTEKAAALSEREAFALIFAPGFSTAAKVTNVSGRGVGMDVVKNNIEGIGGTVEIQSRTGFGTTTRLKIPLTLAIVPAMIIRNREERFAIPQVKLVELFRVEKGASIHQIEYLQDRPIYRLRDKILPLVTLNEVLGISKKEEPITQDVSNIVVLNADGRLFGLIVDEVLDTAEVVVKPMSQFLKSLPLYSGATVLGDGAVALILDVVGIAKQQKLLGETSQSYANAAEDEKKIGIDMQEFLLFRLNATAKHAIPLNLVHRLEEFKPSAIERSGSQRVVRYRNAILPIISLNDYLSLTEVQTAHEVSDSVSIIVLQKSGRFFGIEVNSILDVLNTPANIDTDISDRSGILGNLVTDQEVVVIVDVLEVLDETLKKFKPASSSVTEVKEVNTRPLRILLVEDTAFFRKHVSAVLVRAGHKISVAENGLEALELLNKSNRNDFDLVLSDIEMPKMNGLQLAEAVRKNDVWSAVPMIAITTKFSPLFIEEGKKAGFDAYLEKLNAEVLLGEIARTFKDEPARRNAS